MPPEKAPEFKKPLEDKEVIEKETMTLTCELNKPNMPVQWFKDGKEVKPDKKRITVSMDQYLHQLVIADVTVEDAAKYTCKYGDVSTECTIKVEGRFYKKINFPKNIYADFSLLCPNGLAVF